MTYKDRHVKTLILIFQAHFFWEKINTFHHMIIDSPRSTPSGDAGICVCEAAEIGVQRDLDGLLDSCWCQISIHNMKK